MTGERRLFFALWPTPELRAAIVAATRDAVAEAGGRAVPPANLHVTLAFLGAVPAERVEAVRQAGDAAAAARDGALAAPPADRTVVFDRLRTWGRGGPLVLEPGTPAPTLAALQAALHNRLEAAGFALDRRGFRPHITLARQPSGRVSAAVVPPLHWPFADFVLVESETGPGGSRYAVLADFPATAPSA